MTFNDLVFFHLFFCQNKKDQSTGRLPGVCASVIKPYDLAPNLHGDEFNNQLGIQMAERQIEIEKILGIRPS